MCTGAPLAHFNDLGGGVSKCFFGFEILAKRDFFGSVKDVRIFSGHEKTSGFFDHSIFHQLKSTT